MSTCAASKDERACTKPQDHSGPHVAFSDLTIHATWHDSPRQGTPTTEGADMAETEEEAAPPPEAPARRTRSKKAPEPFAQVEQPTATVGAPAQFSVEQSLRVQALEVARRHLDDGETRPLHTELITLAAWILNGEQDSGLRGRTVVFNYKNPNAADVAAEVAAELAAPGDDEPSLTFTNPTHGKASA